ncbi:MAG TPA: hypothetical protein VK399_01015, partial [Longimicrobiaceae bacterium]|nr:hypothetical protein [Longimicrobiaceae bacterium]
AVQLTNLAEEFLDKGLGAGEGRAGLVTLGGAPALLAVGTAQLARNALGALGVTDEYVVKPIEQAAAAGPFAPMVLMAHGASAVLRAISPEADRAVRDVVKLADFSDPKQPVGAAVQAVSGFVKDLFGGGKPEEPPAPMGPLQGEEAARAQAMLSDRFARMGGGAVKVPDAAPAPAPPPLPASRAAQQVKGTLKEAPILRKPGARDEMF